PARCISRCYQSARKASTREPILLWRRCHTRPGSRTVLEGRKAFGASPPQQRVLVRTLGDKMLTLIRMVGGGRGNIGLRLERVMGRATHVTCQPHRWARTQGLGAAQRKVDRRSRSVLLSTW